MAYIIAAIVTTLCVIKVIPLLQAFSSAIFVPLHLQGFVFYHTINRALSALLIGYSLCLYLDVSRTVSTVAVAAHWSRVRQLLWVMIKLVCSIPSPYNIRDVIFAYSQHHLHCWSSGPPTLAAVNNKECSNVGFVGYFVAYPMKVVHRLQQWNLSRSQTFLPISTN